jgi:8-oxo-dGTP pyrophosphatase MutT (NUDIX family)
MTTNDPWSGNVALPGGKQDEQDRGDDYETAVRETREEVGIDLDDSEFMYLGQVRSKNNWEGKSHQRLYYGSARFSAATWFAKTENKRRNSQSGWM